MSNNHESEGSANDTVVASTPKNKDVISKESEELTEEMIKAMKVVELKEKLGKRNLPTHGVKMALQQRLREYITMHNGDEGKETNDDEETDGNEESSEGETESEMDEGDGEEPAGRKQGGRRRKLKKQTRNETASMFTIKDVEGSLHHFSGDDKMPIGKWVEDFEDMSELLKWNELQKFVYSKRMLQGSAKKFVSFEKHVKSWDKLKRCLIREFQVQKSNADVHMQLFRRRKLPNESSRQYVYEMQEIADQGDVDEEALIQYIIDGIQDHESNKTILYGAHSIRTLKKNLEVYDRMKARSNRRREPPKKEGREYSMKEKETVTSKRDKQIHCYACGSPEHTVKNCTNKDKGPKCFRCNEFGHVSSNCNKEGAVVTNKTRVNCVRSSDDKQCTVVVNDIPCYALIDTGSDVSLIRRDIYDKIKDAKLGRTSRVLTGFGNAQIIPIGQFLAKLVLDKEEHAIDMLVVPIHSMTPEVILGQNFLSRVEVRIHQGHTIVKTIAKDSDKAADSNGERDRENIIKDDEVRELMVVNYIEHDEYEVCPAYRGKIEELISNYKPAKDVNTTVSTKIILRDEEPISQRPRRLSPKEKQILAAQVDEWLKEGIVRPSTSEFSSPVVIVPKKNGDYRVCIDYRKLNKRIVRDRFPMPLIEDSIDSLAEFRVFSVIDLKNGFFHVPVEQNSQKYTSFVTPDGQFEFVKTPFGLCNSPTSFLRFIQGVFQDLVRRRVVFTYMDDLIIPGIDEKDAYDKLVETLKVAEENALEINWDKSRFLQSKIEYLGHEIENGRIYPSPAKTKAVQGFRIPTTRKDVQSFLGLTGYFRKFIRDYAKIARPLSDLLKNGVKFQFGPEQLQSFGTLKCCLANKPVLRIYHPEAITELHTDASKEGYGAVLLQKDVGEKLFHPVYFMSRKTTDAEKNYSSYELEMLAVIRAVQKFRVYLLGIKFKLITDCDAFRKTLFKQDISPKVARWALTLEEFEYEVEHRPGSQLSHVDALSRYPVFLVTDTTLAILRKKQDEDERIRVIKQVLQTEPYEDYLIENGLLMKQFNDKRVIVLPPSMYTEVIRRVHENGHFGVKKMSESIKHEYYIPNLTERLEKFVACCVPCVLSERKKGKVEGELAPIPKGDIPLSTYHVDHLGPMTMTSKAYKYLFVVVDGFSKFVWIYPTKTTNAKEVIAKLNDQQKIFGNPTRIISDRGTAFTSAEFREYCAKENIEHILITTGVPRGNGQVERIHRIIIPVLTKLSLDNPDKWFRYIDRVQRSINSTYQRAVGMSPFELMFGVKMRQKEDIKILELVQQEAAEIFSNDRGILRDVARENLLKIQEENRRNYNKRCKTATQYKEGDLVVIKKTQFDPGSKLKAKFLGPYKISKVKRNNRYEVIRLDDGQGPRVTSTAADYMKPYVVNSSGSEEDSAGMAE